MRVTIRHVAEEAGVSAMTVSNVLRGQDTRMCAETRQRVVDVAQRLNYLPVSPPASQKRHVETRILTFVPEHHEVIGHPLDLFTYEGLAEGARKHGYDLLTMLREGRDPVLDSDEVRFVDRRSDGFIFIASREGKWRRALDIVSRHRIPAVVCFRRNAPDGVAWVDVDNNLVMQQMVEYFVKCGHKRIGYLAGPSDNFDEKQRQSAWVQAMWKHGIELHRDLVIPGTLGDGEFVLHPEAAATVRRLGVTAVACFNDPLALSLWDALESQGVKVPDDVSLIGVDNRVEAEPRGLTTVCHLCAEVGRLAMEAWIELKNGGEPAACCKVAPVHLIARQSVRQLNPSSTR